MSKSVATGSGSGHRACALRRDAGQVILVLLASIGVGERASSCSQDGPFLHNHRYCRHYARCTMVIVLPRVSGAKTDSHPLAAAQHLPAQLVLPYTADKNLHQLHCPPPASVSGCRSPVPASPSCSRARVMRQAGCCIATHIHNREKVCGIFCSNGCAGQSLASQAGLQTRTSSRALIARRFA